MQHKVVIGTILIVLLFIGNVIYIGKKNLWFEPTNNYWTILKSGDGLREGTLVTFNGIKMGEVTELDVTDENLIRVQFAVRLSLAEKITAGSIVRVFRSMMIGEKRLEIMPGVKGAAPLKSGSYLQGEDVRELSDLLSGGDQLQRLMPQLLRLLNNVDIITTSLAQNPDLMDKAGKLLDEAYDLLKTVERSWLFKSSYKEFQQEELRKSKWKLSK
jgi:phospholipid/cholesterol/gamma-HCH transport system substrate-binding protein